MSPAPGGTISEPTHYEVLGVHEGATTDEIRVAWRALIRDIHPDRETDETAKHEATRQAARINNAYSTLTDPAQRSRYDEELAYRRGEQTAPPGGDSGAGYESADAHATDEDDEAMWERIQAEAEAEAEEAWQRWENPSARDRFAEGLAEIRHWDFSQISLAGAYDDFVQTKVGFERTRPGESLWITLPGFTAIMVCLMVGELLIGGAATLYSGAAALVIMGAALAADLFLCVIGARPLKYLAAAAGVGAPPSEGEKLMALAALGVRSVWAGTIGVFLCALAVLLVRWIYHLFAPETVAETVAGWALIATPFVWTLAFVVVCLARLLARERAGGSDSSDTRHL